MWLSIGWVACGGRSGEPSPAARFDDVLSDLVAATARHGDQVRSAPDLAGVAREEDDFSSLCAGYQEDIGACMGAFARCHESGGMGRMGDMGAWNELLGDLWTSVDDHHGAMDACDTLAGCADAEDAWQDAMATMFDRMGQTDPAWDEGCGW
jgi:hypothetical protein